MKMLKVGKGESITIIAEIVDDKDNPIDVNDSMLFAIKRITDDKEFLFSNEIKFSDMTIKINQETGVKTYIHVIEIASIITKNWSCASYLYDWTLVKGTEHFPQTEPLLMIVTGTIGASGNVNIDIGG